MEQYHVSRYTIRRAIGELQNEHYVYRIQGGGCLLMIGKKSEQHTLIIK